MSKRTRQHAPGWLTGLSDMVSRDLDAAQIERNDRCAAIFIAVELLPEGMIAKAVDIRGTGHPLAEAAGALARDRNLPGIIAEALNSALLRRYEIDEQRNNKMIKQAQQ